MCEDMIKYEYGGMRGRKWVYIYIYIYITVNLLFIDV